MRKGFYRRLLVDRLEHMDIGQRNRVVAKDRKAATHYSLIQCEYQAIPQVKVGDLIPYRMEVWNELGHSIRRGDT